MPDLGIERRAGTRWLILFVALVAALVAVGGPRMSGLLGDGSDADARGIQTTIENGLQAAGEACLTGRSGVPGTDTERIARYWSDEVPNDESESLLTQRLADVTACQVGGALTPAAPTTVWDLMEARELVAARALVVGDRSGGGPLRLGSQELDWRGSVQFSLDEVTLLDLRVEGNRASADAEIVQTTTWPGRQVITRHVAQFGLKESAGTWRIVWNRSRPVWSDPGFADGSTHLERVSLLVANAGRRVGRIGRPRSGLLVCGHPAYAVLTRSMTMQEVRDRLGEPRRITVETPKPPAHGPQVWEYAFEGWGGEIDIRFDETARVIGYNCGLA